MSKSIVTNNQPQSPFDSIRRFDANGNEHWLARELMKLLGYKTWQKFCDAIDRAKSTCLLNEEPEANHINHLPGAVKSAGRSGDDYRLSRKACYWVAMAGDTRKPEIALAHQYFATKTREAETSGSELTETIIQPTQLLTRHTAVEYINATATLDALPDSRLKRLLDARLVAELSIDIVNQKQITPVEEVKNYTTATVRAAQLGYSAAQIGDGSPLGKFIKREIAPEFSDWQGQYKVNHYEVCEELDVRIHAYFLTRSL